MRTESNTDIRQTGLKSLSCFPQALVITRKTLFLAPDLISVYCDLPFFFVLPAQGRPSKISERVTYKRIIMTTHGKRVPSEIEIDVLN